MTSLPENPFVISGAELERMRTLIQQLENTIDKADEHTAFLMEKICNLEVKLRAAEYAAKVNWDGWQQELARKSALTSGERCD